MPAASVRLVGVEKCVAKLTVLPRAIQKNVMRKSVRAGGSPFLKAARAKCPTRNRLLKASLTQVLRVYDGTVLAVIGQEKGKRFDKVRKARKHAGGISGRGDLTPIHLVEEEVKPHEITGARDSVMVAHRRVFTVYRKAGGKFNREGTKSQIERRYLRKQSFGRVLKPLAITTAGGTIFRQRVRHPGHRGVHFIRAAAAEAETAGLGAFEQKFVGELMKEA